MHNSIRKIFFLFFFIFVVVTGLTGYQQHLLEQEAIESSVNEIARLAKRTVKAVNLEHLACLATNIYHEASGEPFMGQVAVARVVINRVNYGFGSNPCKVVYQSALLPDVNSSEGVKKVCQFSWVCEGKIQPKNNMLYKQAEFIAQQVLSENKWNDSIPNDILFFHNKSVEPNWSYRRVLIIGNHVFYTREKTSK